MEIALNNQIILIGVAFFAGLISSIAGSGGILTLPALLWVGLPPLNALATNKVQSSLGTLSSAWNFFRKGHLDIKPLYGAVAMAVLGSVAGTFLVQSLDGATLTKLIPFLLLAIALYFLASDSMMVDFIAHRFSSAFTRLETFSVVILISSRLGIVACNCVIVSLKIGK